MKLHLKLLLACSVLSFGVLAQNIPAGYNLVFLDDFNGNQLDETIWNIEVNGNGGGNNELQYYRRENVSVGKDPVTGEGCLILTAKKENYVGKPSTSGRVNTKNKMYFRYGMIEARVKLPYTANGLWPAIWMMGNDYDQVGWPRCGEIDILEMGHENGITNGTQDKYFSGWWHWGTAWDMHGPGAYPNAGNDKTNDYGIQGSYHTFRLYWDEGLMSMYLDQDIYSGVTPYAQLGINGNGDDATATYFKKPFFVLLNLAIGGSFPFIHILNDINNVTAFANTPGGEPKMYIDYIKVYQKGDAGESYYGPAINPPNPPKTNIALGKPATASSEYDHPGSDQMPAGLLKASNVTAGNGTGSRWGSNEINNQYTQEWIMIDLQNEYEINEIVILWEGAFAKSYNIETSVNGNTWQSYYSTTTGAGGNASIENDATARYIRINCTEKGFDWNGTYYGYSIYEVEVYGEATPSDDLPVNAIQGISLFPNPVENNLYIQSESGISGVILSDVKGRKLFEQQNVNSVDMTGYTAGLYLLTIKFSDGRIIVRKVIKR